MICAKRTQFQGVGRLDSGRRCTKQCAFPADGISHHSTILSFHHSSPVPIMQNEANLPPCPAGRGHDKKRSQSAADGSARGAGRQGRSAGAAEPERTKRTQFGGGGPSCKTKPICCGRPTMGARRRGRPYRCQRARLRKAKPIPGGAGRVEPYGGWPWRAAQTKPVFGVRRLASSVCRGERSFARTRLRGSKPPEGGTGLPDTMHRVRGPTPNAPLS